ncbi:MAG: S8 family serine peptidase [Halanaerobacter sp.]
MKKSFYLLLALVVAVGLLAGCSSQDKEISQEVQQSQQLSLSEYVGGELIVSLEEPGDIAVQNTEKILTNQSEKIKDENFEVLRSFLGTADGELNADSFSDDFKADLIADMGFVYLVEYSSDFESLDEAKAALRDSLEEEGAEVRYIEPNYKVSAIGEDVDNEMHDRQEWHYEMVNTPQAWELAEGTKDTKVAILDTGIDAEHKNLADFVDDSLAKNYTDDPAGDEYGHGTHVAGTVASYGVVSGVMKEASLISVKVLSDSGSGSLFDVAEGITYAASVDADVINMSLGGSGYNQVMADATENAAENGTILVAASGNDSSAEINYPSLYPDVIAVGAVNKYQERAPFSNYGDGLEIMAPGVSIYSTYPDDEYKSLQGTSMAAPHVAGVVGLMRAANTEITTEGVREILKETAQEAGESKFYGFGIVDAYEAVKEAGDFVDYDSTYEQVYLRGSFNDWNTEEMELVDDHSWQTGLELKADDRFKFDIHGDWSLNFGDDNGDGSVEEGGDDIYVSDAGTYVITFNDETKEYKVEEEKEEEGFAAKVILDKGDLPIDILEDKATLYTAYHENEIEAEESIKEDSAGNYFVEFAGLNPDENYTFVYRTSTDYKTGYMSEVQIFGSEEDVVKEDEIEETDEALEEIRVNMEIDGEDESILSGEKANIYFDGELQGEDKISTWHMGTVSARFEGVFGDYKVEVDTVAEDGNRYVGEVSFELNKTQGEDAKVVDLKLEQKSKYQSNYEQFYFRGTPNSWDAEEMELIDDYTWQTSIDADKDDRFKFDAYGDWSLNFGDDNEDGSLEEGGDDIYFAAAGNYQIRVNTQTKEYTLTTEEIEGLAAILYEVDNGDAEEILYSKIELSKDGEFYEEYDVGNNSNEIPRTIIQDLPAGDYEADLDTKEDDYHYTGKVSFSITEDGESVEKTMKVNKEEVSDYESDYEQVHFRSTSNDWDTEEMKLVDDYTWEITVDFAGNNRLKFDVYGDWSLNFGDSNEDGYVDEGGDDIYFAETGTFEITLNTQTKKYSIHRAQTE